MLLLKHNIPQIHLRTDIERTDPWTPVDSTWPRNLPNNLVVADLILYSARLDSFPFSDVFCGSCRNLWITITCPMDIVYFGQTSKEFSEVLVH